MFKNREFIFSILILLPALFIILLTPKLVMATTLVKLYTPSEVAKHNTESDCYMIFESDVYNVTSFVKKHDSMLDIRSWCGKEMTKDFQDKAGIGRDHKSKTYELLNTLKVGYLTSEKITSSTALNNPYNFWIPAIGGIIVYLLTYALTKIKIGGNYFPIAIFNMVWNFVLVLLMIPSVLFGFYMTLKYEFPSIGNVKFDFTYWHVEGSIVFAVIIVLHIIHRFHQLYAPIHMLLPRKKS